MGGKKKKNISADVMSERPIFQLQHSHLPSIKFAIMRNKCFNRASSLFQARGGRPVSIINCDISGKGPPVWLRRLVQDLESNGESVMYSRNKIFCAPSSPHLRGWIGTNISYVDARAFQKSRSDVTRTFQFLPKEGELQEQKIRQSSGLSPRYLGLHDVVRGFTRRS